MQRLLIFGHYAVVALSGSWIDRGYEGYLMAACIMNRVNSINVKHRPYDQAVACRHARIRDSAAGVIGGRR